MSKNSAYLLGAALFLEACRPSSAPNIPVTGEDASLASCKMSAPIKECLSDAIQIGNDTQQSEMKTNACDSMSDNAQALCQEAAIIDGVRARRKKMAQCLGMVELCMGRPVNPAVIENN